MSQEHWESYYRGGALASCPLGLEPNYTREVRDLWVAFFSSLPDGARILDIGTGNGAIALIAVETAAALGRSYAVDGVDVAQIDPARYVKDGARLFKDVRFHAGVSAEALPFEPGSFDAVSGQYALEWTDCSRSLAETFRVLKSGGRAQFILHHRDSIIVENAAESLRHAAVVLDETKVFRLFRRYVEAERASPRSATKQWQEIVAAGEFLQRKARESRSSMLLAMTLDSLRHLFEQRGNASPAALERAVEGMEAELRASVRRLQDVVAAAKSQEDIAELVRVAEATGFGAIGFGPQLHSGDKLVGWRLNLDKA
jgi:ubiquinone/menaquinone biosynthesis C-methylase UbiE